MCVKGKEYRAITNIGCKPTVTEEKKTGVESYLYDFEGDIYGEEAEVYLLKFHRPERRFDSVDELQRQVRQDIDAGKS